MAEPLVVGIDSSTQSTKAVARELHSGRVVATGHSPHPPTTPPTSEQDPAAWWHALVDAVGQLGDVRRDVQGLSVAGQQHGLVVTDADGVPLRPAKLWNDTESAPQAAALVERLGATVWAKAVGSVPVAAFTITKLAWLAAHEPGVLARTERVFLPHDWLTFRLTGEHVTDRGDASGTGWFDPTAPVGEGGSYRPDLLAAALEGALPEVADPGDWLDRLPVVLRPGQAAGPLTAGAAERLGLGPHVIVAAGTGDNMAAALGLGLRPGDVAISLGTSGTVYSVSETPTADPTGAVAGFADATGRYLPLVCTLNATKVTDTVARWLGTDPAGLAALALAADAAREHRPTLVPYFDGERTPNLPDATGSVTGLRNDTTREDLALAAHDGVLRSLLAGLDALRTAGVAADGRVHLVGGGARSPAYRQRLADLLGEAIVVPDEGEAVAGGAAVQAAAVVGGDSSDVDALAGAWELGHGLVVGPSQ